MSLRDALLANWPYKVAAIALAILLWLNVTADEERQDQPLETRLEIEVQDTAWSVREAPAEVTTIFEGTRGAMIALFNRPVVRKVIPTVTDTVAVLRLTSDDVVYDRRLNVRPTAVVPAEVTVTFEPRVTKRVPVVAHTDAQPAAGFVIEAIQVQPDSATLRGPASRLAAVTRIATDRLDAGLLDHRLAQQLSLDLPEDLTGVTVEPTSVLVAIEVDSLVARTFEVPVRATGAGGRGVALEPPTVRVVVTGGAAAVQSLAATDLRASVQIDAPIDEPRSFAVRVALPDDVRASVNPDPPRVTVRPSRSGG